jgi:two-component system, NtrC family, response regulator AtoC
MVLGPDDEARWSLQVLLAQQGYEVVATPDVSAARKHFAASACDVVLTTPELAAQLAGEPMTPVMIALVRSIDDEATITASLRSIVVPNQARSTTDGAKAAPGPSTIEAPVIIGAGAAMARLKETIRLVAQQRTTVLILGESGTGKELVARSIHAQSPRRDHKFVAINCAALPATLLETELFGHARGAFTDAVKDRVGLFEEADGGTLFLDEVGELPPSLQAKLLRALQESEIRRVGENESIKIDVRLITATLRDLMSDVAAGRFREDLFYRLNVVPIVVPPLRDRVEDIRELAEFFVASHGRRHNRTVGLTDAAIAALAGQLWPGNVRELENVIERAVVLAETSLIDVDFLGSLMKIRAGSSATDDQELSIKKATRSLEQDLIRRALGVTQGNRTNAAKLLEISHRALLYKMKEYGIS